MLAFFIKGITIGLAVAIPVGPISILCIRRTLHDGFKIGLMTGLGAATVHGIYGAIIDFGLTSIAHLLVKDQAWIKIVGALILCYLGIRILRTPFKRRNPRLRNEKSGLHAYTTAMLLALLNPLTILFLLAAITSLGLASHDSSHVVRTALVAGITAGSALWWLVLTTIVAFVLHHRLSDKTLHAINIGSGIVIIVFAIISFSAGLYAML